LVGVKVKSTDSAVVEIATVWLAVAVCVFVSVTVTDTVKGPAVLKVVVKLLPDPLDGVPPVAVQANE